MAAAEHRKLAAELEAVLDWLHANEATVRSRPLLERDSASVQQQIHNHKVHECRISNCLMLHYSGLFGKKNDSFSCFMA
jgi:hypothetical protein